MATRSTKVGLAVLLGVLAGNAIAAVFYFSQGAGAERAPDAARELRREGIEAMERADYKAAARAFTAALKMDEPPEDLARLLSVAQEQVRATQADTAEPARARSPEASSPKASASPPPPTAPKPSPPARERKTEPNTRPRAAPVPAAEARTSDRPETATPPSAAESEPSTDDEGLPYCPEGEEEITTTGPYALIPQKCRPRP